MKTLKKLFSVSAIVALLGTLAPMYAFGAGKYSDELEEAYAYAYKHEITTMSSIDNANMYGDLDRIAMAKMLANYAIDVLGLTPDTTKACTFPDVSASLDEEYDNGVTKACQLGLMGVGITNFNPKGKVTRAEFGTALSRALNHGSDNLAEMNAANPYWKEHLNFLKSEGIMNNISNPSMTEVRGYVMIMMMRADGSYTPSETCTLEERVACLLGDNAEACLAACQGEEPEEPENPGYAKVTTKAAADQTVALNAVDKKIGTVTLKAGDNDTTVTNIQITKSGLGDSKGIKNISLVKNDEYATNSVSLKNNVATLRFSPALTIKANSSETFDVVVSTSDAAAAGGQYEFAVTSVNVSNGTFDGTPAKLGGLTTTNYKVGTGNVEDLAGANVKAGDEKTTIATIKYKPYVDATVNSITLTSNQDELYNAFKNAKAYIDDALVGTVSINNDTIVIKDMDTDVEKNDTIEVVLKADVVYVGSNGTFKMSIEENHVNAIEKSTNERMATDGFAASSPATDIKVTGLGVTLKNNGEKTTTTVGSSVTLLDMTISSSEDVNVTAYYVDFGQAKATVLASFEDLVVSIDGTEYDIDNTTTFNGTKVEFAATADKFNVSADNSVKVKVTAKVLADTTPSYTLEFGMTEFKVGTTPITGTTVKKSGHQTTIGGHGTLTLTKTATEGSTISTEEKDILAFNLKAKNEDLQVTSITFGLEMDDVLSGVFESIELYQGSNQLGDTIDDKEDTNFVRTAANTYTVTFNSLGQTVKADETLPFTLRLKLEKVDSDVIGKVITGSIAINGIVAKGKTSKVTPINNTTSITGKGYQVTTSKSTVSVEKAGKIMYVTVNNNSEYPMVIDTLVLDVDSNMISGTNMMVQVGAQGYTMYKDNTEGDVIFADTALIFPNTITSNWNNATTHAAVAAVAGSALAADGVSVDGTAYYTRAASSAGEGLLNDGTYAYTFYKTGDGTRTGVTANTYYPLTTIGANAYDDDATYPVVPNGSSATFAIEMNSSTTIENAFYEGIAKSLKFYYVENYSEGDYVDTTTNTAITEKY